MMLIPQYWSEARVQRREERRQLTIRRFGWSDVSQAEADEHARTRAEQALDRKWNDDSLGKFEPRVAYNGAKGVPIREEIVQRRGDVVVTRNAYGALCLNTPDTFFADFDFPDRASYRMGCAVYLGLVALTAAVGLETGLGWKVVLFWSVLLPLIAAYPVSNGLWRLGRRLRGGEEVIARRRILSFVTQHPEWKLRTYRTPAGFRLPATHQTFEPADNEVRWAFESMGCDPMYSQLCRRQNCFRARISPQPWRVGLGRHIRPRRTWFPLTLTGE